MMPAVWAAATAPAIWTPYRNASASGSFPRLNRLGQRLAFQVLHHQEVRPVVVTNLEEGADVRMAQRGDDAGFAL